MMTTGVLFIDKPSGMTSTQVGRIVKKKLGERSVGHVGTLDPLAQGVLTLVLGRATRLEPYLLPMAKTYECTVQLGVATDTFDTDGSVVEVCGREPQWHKLDCQPFLGEKVQTPPIYSAVKYKGRPLYDYARKGEESKVDWSALGRKVTIHSLHILECDTVKKTITFKATVSKGTYIRTLAHDIAVSLGSIGVVNRLIRTQACGVKREQCHCIELPASDLKKALTSLEDLQLDISRVENLSEQNIQTLFTGCRLSVKSPLAENETVLLVADTGTVVGLGLVVQSCSSGVEIKLKRGLL